jgi:GT2 family glycosyltransferase
METLANRAGTDPASRPFVLIVILNWNNCDETLTAIGSVLKMDYPNFQVLIVDNGSTGNDVSELKKITGERVHLLESAQNTGYTGGCNLGLARALELGGDYVWLLNNDAVVRPETLTSLVNLAESDPAIGLVTPMIASLDEAPHLTFAGGICCIKTRRYWETNDPEVARQWASNFPDAGLVIGTAMLVCSRLVQEIGVLDQRFFAYFEDIDYSARSSNAGFRNVVDFSSVVYHAEKNRNTKPHEIKPHYWYYMARNETHFWRKHMGPLRSLRRSWDSFNGFVRHRNRLTDVACSEAILAGLWHGWLGKGGAYEPRYRMPNLVAGIVKLYGRRPALRPVTTLASEEQA